MNAKGISTPVVFAEALTPVPADPAVQELLGFLLQDGDPAIRAAAATALAAAPPHPQLRERLGELTQGRPYRPHRDPDIELGLLEYDPHGLPADIPAAFATLSRWAAYPAGAARPE